MTTDILTQYATMAGLIAVVVMALVGVLKQVSPRVTGAVTVLVAGALSYVLSYCAAVQTPGATTPVLVQAVLVVGTLAWAGSCGAAAAVRLSAPKG